MSLEGGTLLRNGKKISLISEENTSSSNETTESNMTDSDVNDDSDISSQLSERRKILRKISELQSEFSQLKNLMMAVISKSNNDSPSTSSQGLSKRPQVGYDMMTGVRETHFTRPSSIFTSNIRRYTDEDTDEEGDSTPRSHEERLLNAIETIPQRIKSSTTNTKLLQTHIPNFRGQKDKFVEFEHLLLNHLSPLANKITEENKLHFFQSLLRNEVIEDWQAIQITPVTTL